MVQSAETGQQLSVGLNAVSMTGRGLPGWCINRTGSRP